MFRSFSMIAMAVILLAVFGCSGASNPVSPSDSDQSPSVSSQNTPDVGEPNSGHSLMGYWEFTVDPETGHVEYVPLRTTELHLNMVPILQAKMGLSLSGKPTVVNGVLKVNVKLTHPFVGKMQLSGFDVKGIVITEGSKEGFGNPEIKIAGPLETRLLNADGFTRWWNPKEFLNSGLYGYVQGNLGHYINPVETSILNGYKLFADDLNETETLSDLDLSQRAIFKAGSSNIRHYEISLAGGFKFNYAVDCSWVKPSPNPPVNLPGDFPMEANQAEPWFIHVTETNNTLWYEAGNHGGNVNYKVVVHDWQGFADVGALTFECPGVFSFTKADPDSEDQYTGTYHFNVVLPTLTSAKPLDVLITAEVPGGYDLNLTGVNKPLRAYHRHLTMVSDTDPVYNKPPVSLMHATTPVDIYTGQTVSFDATASYDPDGYITQYLWDFNNDGVYGDSHTGDPSTPTRIFNTPGNYAIKLKVRDNSTGSTISEPVEVHVTLETNDPPVAVAIATTEVHILEGGTISFDGSGSYDIDGTIFNWKWDFNGDGNYNDVFSGPMQTPTATFLDPGEFDVDLKVYDDGGATDTLDQKIHVIVDDIPNVPPTASAIATTSTDIHSCGSVTFDASASSDFDGTIEDYKWDFNGDGIYGDSFDSGTKVKPTRFFNGAGSWNVDLKVIDDEGGEDTLDATILVTATNIDPVANMIATTPTNIYATESVTFDASGSTDPDCADKLIYQWDFNGDSIYGDTFESGTDQKPVKTFNQVGSFNVTVKVLDTLGGQDISDIVKVTVNNHPPVACAEITTEWPYYWKENMGFSAACADDPDGNITLYEWDLGADGTYEKTGQDVQFYFADAGEYQMQLRVTDNIGATDLLDAPLEFSIFDDSNQPPAINEVIHSRTTSLRGSTAEAVSLSVNFTDNFPPGDVHTYLWSCPQGSFNDPTSPTPVWTPPNLVVKCEITVRVTDAFGMWDEGTCQQWVTKWPTLKTNSNAVDMDMIIPGNLEDALTSVYIDPASFKFPTVSPNGNAVYINIWATWCGYCIMEMPNLQEIYNMYKDEDYIHILLNIGESKTTVVNWINANPYTATYWLLDPTSAYWNKTRPWNGGSGGIPQHLVFDRDGRCRGARVGSIHSVGSSAITQYLSELI